MRGRLLLLCMMMIFAWSGPSKFEMAEIKREQACQVAEAVVSDWRKFHGDYNYRFSSGTTSPYDEIGYILRDFAYDVRENRVSQKWPRALMRQLPKAYFDEFSMQTGSRPFVQCSSLTQIAASKGHSVGSGPEGDIYVSSDLVIFKEPFVGFSLPYVSKHGRDALFVYSMGGSNDSGHSAVVLYRKNDLGCWEMIDEIWVSIS